MADAADDIWDAAPPRRVVLPRPPAPSSSSDTSSTQSVDSATRRAQAAELHLMDHNPGGQAADLPQPLPSAHAAFGEVDGPPAFLDPEATRKLAPTMTAAASRAEQTAAGAASPAGGRGAGEWDVSRLAPKLVTADGKARPGVISAAAVRYKGEDQEGLGAVSAAQLALLGGSIPTVGADRGSIPTIGRPSGKEGEGAKPRATKAMAVEEFIEKGVGGAALPRKRQERKDREKDKRLKGQSTHAEWKTETEMALRQQYD